MIKKVIFIFFLLLLFATTFYAQVTTAVDFASVLSNTNKWQITGYQKKDRAGEYKTLSNVDPNTYVFNRDGSFIRIQDISKESFKGTWYVKEQNLFIDENNGVLQEFKIKEINENQMLAEKNWTKPQALIIIFKSKK